MLTFNSTSITVDISKFHVYSLFWGSGSTSTVKLAIDGKVLFNSSFKRVATRGYFDILYGARQGPPATIGTNNVVQVIIKNIVYETGMSFFFFFHFSS